MGSQTDTAGRMWHQAPTQSAPPNTGSIQGVWLWPGESVQWSWSPDGTYVNGFTIQNPAEEIQQIELPKKIRESLEKLSAFKRSVEDSLGIPKRLMKNEDRKKQ